MLTRRQRELLDFVRQFQKDNGWCPSYAEMAAALDFDSKSSVHRLVKGLVERGYIRQMKGRTRALEVLPERATVTALSASRDNRAQLEAAMAILNRALMANWTLPQFQAEVTRQLGGQG